VPGKQPMAVAVSIAAELLTISTSPTPASAQRGLPWSSLRDLLKPTDQPVTSPANGTDHD
ncbi:MAG: xanthine dehydrogenase accessory protein XdhC, partial [Natronospirillum sp.]